MRATRRIYLDNIRWITVCIVVIYHVIYMFNGVQTFGVIGPFRERQWQDAFQYLVYPWFMALLFAVSGMAARYYLEGHDTKAFVRDKTRKLLVPSTIGLFVFQWILGYYNMKIGGGWESFGEVPVGVRYVILAISGTGVLWYIQVLWIFSMLLLLVRKAEKDRLWKLGEKTPVWVLILLTIGLYGAAQILNTPIVTVYRFGIYGFCFFAGYFLFSHDVVVGRLNRWWWILLLVAAGSGIFYTVRFFGENYATEPVVNNLPACMYCWSAILAILAFMKKYGNRENPITRWMTGKSWGIYVFHYLPLACVAYYLKKFAPELPAVVAYLSVGVSSFAGALLLNEIISRIPVIRWCVLGLKKEKKMFKDNLISMRKMHGYSQEELAEKIGVSRQTLSKYETGESLPDIEKCRLLANALDVSMDDLVNYDKEASGNLGLEVPPKGKHVFGITKVGEKGQIVIPAKARKIFDIHPGDNLILLGDESQGIAVIKEDRLLDMLKRQE